MPDLAAVDRRLRQILAPYRDRFSVREDQQRLALEVPGYQGQRWQEHRSGWTPDDFPGWRCFVEEHFHKRDGQYFGAFFAIWDRKQ